MEYYAIRVMGATVATGDTENEAEITELLEFFWQGHPVDTDIVCEFVEYMGA